MRVSWRVLSIVCVLFISSFSLAFSQASAQECAAPANCTASLQGDLGVELHVKLPGSSAYVSGISDPATAPKINVGEEVTWQVIIKNNASQPISGKVKIIVLVPSEFNITGAVAADGTTFDSTNLVWEAGPFSDLNETKELLVSSVASNNGEALFMVEIKQYIEACEGECLPQDYEDQNYINNSALAYVSIEAKPGAAPNVLGASSSSQPKVQGEQKTLSGTGSAAMISQIVAILLVVAAVVVRRYREAELRD